MATSVLQLVRAILIAVPLFAMPAFAQVIFSTAFDGIDPPAGLTIYPSSNFHINVGGGVATFSRDQLDPQSTTPRNGTTYLTTDFKIFGDFVATIDVNVIDLSGGGDAGINITYPAGSAGIFVQGPGGQSGLTSLINWICSSAGCHDGILFSAGVVKRLRVQRAGSTIYLYAETSLAPGFFVRQSETNASLTEPVAFSLFLGEEFNGTRPRQVEFDNLTITAGSFLQLEPSIVDPVPALLNGSALTRLPTAAQASNAPFLGDTSKGRSVRGVAADGVAQLLLRIPTPSVGEVVSVTLKNGQCGDPASSGCAKDYGLIFDPTNPPADLYSSVARTASPVTVPAYRTSAGPMGFIAYRAPLDFARSDTSGIGDITAASREVTLDIGYAGGSYRELKILIVRPAVMLIHGFNSDSASWDDFQPFIGKTGIYAISKLDYGQRLYQAVGGPGHTFTYVPSEPDRIDFLSTSPVVIGYITELGVSPLKLYGRFSHLGFSNNAPRVLKKLKQQLDVFARGENPADAQVAAVQSDIVAHSMGGLVARYMPLLSDYFFKDNFAQGYIHKMVSIGTPHLGTPQAAFILTSWATCAREVATTKESISFERAVASRDSIPIRDIYGAVGELQGDGINLSVGVTSPALTRINSQADSFPIATIRGDATPRLSLLDSSAAAIAIRRLCPSDYYAQLHTSKEYPKIFDPIVFNGREGSATPYASDGSVPLSSATFRRIGSADLGYTHSQGISSIFSPLGAAPYLLDNTGVIASKAELLINTSVRSPSFQPAAAAKRLP